MPRVSTSRTGRSIRLIACAALGLALCLTAVPVAEGARKTKRCKASQARQTVTYKTRKGGRTHRLKACVPRRAPTLAGSLRAAVPVAFRESRRLATRMTPKRIAKLRRTRAARRVAAADRVTDAALGAGLAIGGRVASARASRVDTQRETGTIKGPPGTRTVETKVGTLRDDSEPNPGGEREVATDTRSRRIADSSSRSSKVIRVEDSMARCPDAAGVAGGRVKIVIKETFTMERAGGGRGVVEDTDTFDGEVKAQFADTARIASATTTGTWSLVTQTRSGSRRGPRNFVSGTISGTELGPDTGGNHRNVRLTTTVTGASGDKPALHGALSRSLFADAAAQIVVAEVLSGIQRRAESGDCVRIEADPASVHVKARGTVAFGARLIGADGAPFDGPINAQAERGGTVAPETAHGTPRAAFTYHALPFKPPGGTDSIGLRHTSKRGRARTGGVTVIYDDTPSHSYRVLAARLDETYTATKPGASFPGCPQFRNSQTNTLSLGVQPAPLPFPGANGHLLEGPNGFIGQITTFGPASVSTQVSGCNVGTLAACAGTGSATQMKDIGFDITLPTTGPAQLRWRFDDKPSAGLGGSEVAFPPCLAPPIGGSTGGDLAAGARSVPRALFEAATPQTLSVTIELELVAPDLVAPGQIHAVETYSITIQRVRDDGSPL
jgi:hypothetical protein